MNAIAELKLSNTSTEHERELTITVSQELVSKEYDSALRSIQQVASRPGFRPGKMPKSMVQSFYGDEINKKLVDKLIEKSFEDALKKESLTPISQPKVEPVSEITSEKPFTYRAIFQVKPTIKLEKYKGINVELKNFSFADTDIDEEINSLRESQATFVEPKDRKTITDNDMVVCDSDVKVDGEINPAFSHKDYSIPLFADNVPNDLKEALVGKSIGDCAEVPYDMPADDQEEELKGKKLLMLLTIKSFKERVLPNLDDDLAKDIHEKFATLEDLKTSIRERFTTAVERRNEYFRQDGITKALIENNPVDVPPALVERMAMSLINRELQSMDKKVADEVVKSHWDEMWNSVQDRALFRVKAELIFEALISELEISASDEEVQAKMGAHQKVPKEDATYSVQVEKLLNIIEKEAQIKKVEEPLFKKGA